MPEELQMRIHGDCSQPTLVYLPGLHGDWTLVGPFRRAVGDRTRFVEITYPRTLTWSLDDYAAAVETALLEHGITRGWLLGESFSSQVVWPMVARRRFQIEGIILAGGFVRHPMRGAVWLVQRAAGRVPLQLIIWNMFAYARLARFRHRRSPIMRAEIQEFISRRTELDRQAATHRLQLLAGSDLRDVARQLGVPLYAVNGCFDPIVPWMFVRPWLRRHCPALREYKVVWPADHNVLSTGTDVCANAVMRWMSIAVRPVSVG